MSEHTKQPNEYFWQGERIRLRARAAADRKQELRWLTDTETERFLDYTVHPPASEEDAERSRPQPAGRILWSIETLDRELVGTIALDAPDQKNGTFHFTMRIAREHRRKGYGEEALRILLRYAFNELRLQKCNIACIETNGPAIALYQKLGFREEGRRRRDIFTNGRFYDNVLLGLIKEEYRDENGGQEDAPLQSDRARSDCG